MSIYIEYKRSIRVLEYIYSNIYSLSIYFYDQLLILLIGSCTLQGMTKNYYQILNLRRDSTDREVAESYQKMVLRWHPKFAKEDHNTAYHYFSQISQAYEVLSDPIKRSFYDKYGWEKLKEGLFAEGELKGGYRFGNNPDEIFDKFFLSNNVFARVLDKEVCRQGSLFSHAFGGLYYHDEANFQDLVVEVTCTLNELYIGVAKEATFQRSVLNLDGRTTSLVQHSKIIEVKPGYSDSTVLTFPGEGHQTVHRKNSNLIFKIKTSPHPQYLRMGDDLIYTAEVRLSEALNCKLVQMLSLDSRKLRVSIDEIVSPSTLREVKGEGMPTVSGEKGNLYIKFNIMFPTSLNEEKKQQLRKLLP